MALGQGVAATRTRGAAVVTPERWRRVKDVFDSAVERDGDERIAFLDHVCADDPSLRHDVDSLIACDARGAQLSESPMQAIGAALFEQAALLGDAGGGDHGSPHQVESRLEPSLDWQAVAGGSGATRLRLRDQVGPYQVLELLGTGGMGEIYKAVDTRLGRAVALKLISSAHAGSAVAASILLREARAASALNHRNICTIFDVGEHHGEPWLVMELLEGHTLDAMIASGPIPFRRLLPIAEQIADALVAAHAAGIVHRDIKPGNIFVTRSGEVKILDFGLAKATADASFVSSLAHSGEVSSHPPLTASGARPGTAGYMSPEQVRGEVLDGRSDLFSLGVVLYEMALGRSPFGGTSRAQLITAIQDDRPVDLDGLQSSTSAAFVRIVRKALQKRRENRYQTASALSTDLRRLSQTRRPALVAALGLLAALTLAMGSIPALRPASSNPRNSEWIQLTNFADPVTDPSLSPDGKMLTFLRGPRTFTTPGQVYVMSLPDGKPRPLTADDRLKMAPVFSPDGSRIAYTRIDEKWSWDTWTVPVGGGPPAPLLRNASGFSWIAGGRTLFSEIKTGLHMGIVTSDEKRSPARDVYLPRNRDYMAHRSSLSPDGRWILVAEMGAGSAWLRCRLVPFDGGSEGREVGPANGGCTTAAWSTDGRWMYFTSNASGAFHIWRQAFPAGTPQQITFGASEEEGLAMAPDGRSLITAVGSGTRTVWIHDANGDRALSEEGQGFYPQFSSDGRIVFYLVGERPGAFAARSGELWAVDRFSNERRLILGGHAITGFFIDAERRRVVFKALGPDKAAALWAAPLDGQAPPRQLAANVSASIVTGDEIFVAARDGSLTYVDRMAFDGTKRTRAIADPIVDLMAVSPDGQWLAVHASIAVDGVQRPVVLYPLHGRGPVFALCASCFVSWLPAAPGFHIRFGSVSDADERPAYVLPIPAGESLPALFTGNRLVSEPEVARAPGVRVVSQGFVSFGPDLGTFVYTKTTVHRNLFRIPLD
jgi:serine/threonine protein kinase